jgi:MFS family permease
MNGLQSLEQWREYFGYPAGAMLGFINAAQSLGSVFALPLVGWFSDKFGRKPILLAGILMIIIATVIQAASINIAMFIVSRFVVGFGGMFVVQPSPMLIAELAYPTHRGKYTSAFWTMYYLGMLPSSTLLLGTNVLYRCNPRIMDNVRNSTTSIRMVLACSFNTTSRFPPNPTRFLVLDSRISSLAD